MIGTDPHKGSATIEVRDEREILLATGRFPLDKTGYRQLLGYARQWPARVWAVEGATGVGRPLAARLFADGETVLDVPAKLAARVRVFDTGLHAHERHRPVRGQLSEDLPAVPGRLAGDGDAGEAVPGGALRGPVQSSAEVLGPAPESLTCQHFRVVIADHDHLLGVGQVDPDDRVRRRH